MMMMLHQDKTKKNLKKGTFFILVCLICLFCSSSFAEYFHGVTQPVWKFGIKVQDWLSPSLSYFSSREELFNENKELKEQVNAMSSRVADRSFLLHENTVLKESLGRREIEPERIFAVVLAKPDMTPYDILVVDVGKDKSVLVGDLVLFENVVLGEVVEVYQTSSKVRLYSTSKQKVSVFIGDSAIGAEVQGLGGGNFEIKLPRESGVFAGDSIYVSDINPRILGTVEYINSDPNEVFEKVLFRSPVNLFSLRFVDIIHSSHE